MSDLAQIFKNNVLNKAETLKNWAQFDNFLQHTKIWAVYEKRKGLLEWILNINGITCLYDLNSKYSDVAKLFVAESLFMQINSMFFIYEIRTNGFRKRHYCKKRNFNHLPLYLGALDMNRLTTLLFETIYRCNVSRETPLIFRVVGLLSKNLQFLKFEFLDNPQQKNYSMTFLTSRIIPLLIDFDISYAFENI